MKHRKTLGFVSDALETYTLTEADPQATERIFNACDWEYDERDRLSQIASVLKRLSPQERLFATAVLAGKTWHDMSLGKRGFNKRLAKIIEKFFEVLI